MLQDAVNAVKNSLETFRRPMAPAKVREHMTLALAGDETAIKAIMAPLREVG